MFPVVSPPHQGKSHHRTRELGRIASNGRLTRTPYQIAKQQPKRGQRLEAGKRLSKTENTPKNRGVWEFSSRWPEVSFVAAGRTGRRIPG